MPEDKKCQHVPDPKSVAYAYHDNNGYVVVDFNCTDCGLSGSAVILFKEINWE
jgi:hypothetical protein